MTEQIKQVRKPVAKYAKKRRLGVEINHRKHPASGVPWCGKCIEEGRCLDYDN